MAELSEIAERILTSTSLDEKLRFSPDPREVTDTRRQSLKHLPKVPGRPIELKITEKGVKPEFPAASRLDEAHQRAVMMHFLCNHEMLATELMALVLLKFPEAPTAFRLGVYETLREEQAHTLMYLRRMRECGMEFGELPVNDYFWRTIAPMTTPMDFVARLSLTFEQANLDFSKHFAKIFRRVGDSSTAVVLEKIYRDEINHVGHGLKWFRQWKDPEESDWQAFSKILSFPLHPSKAKGLAPFNAKGRADAGLSADFIRNLKLSEQSRGRTPVLHWMNPLAESHALAAQRGHAHQASEAEAALADDFNTLAWISCKRDDCALVHQIPSLDFLEALTKAGFKLPEFALESELQNRRLSGLSPWAASPDSYHRGKNFHAPHLPKLPPWIFSQQLGDRLNVALGSPSVLKSSSEAIEQAITQLEKPYLKALFSCAGRGNRPFEDSPSCRQWISNRLQDGGLLVEPQLKIVREFSVLYEVKTGLDFKLVGFTHLMTDFRGRYLGTRILPKWASGLDAEEARFLFAEANIEAIYGDKIPTALASILPDSFSGPLAIDAALHRLPCGKLALKAVMEVNARRSMGRLAWDLHQRCHPSTQGHFKIIRAHLQPNQFHPPVLRDGRLFHGQISLNDPSTSKQFRAIWSCSPASS